MFWRDKSKSNKELYWKLLELDNKYRQVFEQHQRLLAHLGLKEKRSLPKVEIVAIDCEDK
jgi:hypothetical protein